MPAGGARLGSLGRPEALMSTFRPPRSPPYNRCFPRGDLCRVLTESGRARIGTPTPSLQLGRPASGARPRHPDGSPTAPRGVMLAIGAGVTMGGAARVGAPVPAKASVLVPCSVNELYVDDPDKDSGGKIDVSLNISLPNLHCECEYPRQDLSFRWRCACRSGVRTGTRRAFEQSRLPATGSMKFSPRLWGKL